MRLAKRLPCKTLSSDFARIIGAFHLDPDLDVSAALALLLAVAMEVAIRFREYSQWPYLAYTLSSTYNPDGYISACVDFVGIPDEQLDVGFGLPLRRLANRAGSTDTQRFQYLISHSVQAALVWAFESSAASSLPAERAFAATKRSEAPRLCHVATASRNQILRQYLRQRLDLLSSAEAASAALRVSLHTNVQSLAWELCPGLAGDALEKRASTRLKQYIACNEAMLKAEVLRRRSVAASALKSYQRSGVPFSQEPWIAWFRRYHDDFYKRMFEAGPARRAANLCLDAAPDAPSAAPRLFRREASVRFAQLPHWQQLLVGRSGWMLVKSSLPQSGLYF